MSKFTDFVGAFTRRLKPRPKSVPVEPGGPRIIETSGNADLTDAEMERIYGDFGFCRPGCPDCRHSSFYTGPQGGGSQNYRCALCGMGYNLTGRVGDHRIGLPRHLWIPRIKEYRSLLHTLLASHGFQTSDENWGIVKDGHHGIWIWPHQNFATIPTDESSLTILTWNVFEWDKHHLQLPDPGFVSQLHEALVNDNAHPQ